MLATKLIIKLHTNLNGTIYGEYPTILAASKVINCNEKTIRRALKTEKKISKKTMKSKIWI